jgi:hypothetical protein
MWKVHGWDLCSQALWPFVSHPFFTIHALPNAFVSNIHMVMTILISCVTVKLLLWNFPLHIFFTMLYLHSVSANSILHTNVLVNTDPPCVSYWFEVICVNLVKVECTDLIMQVDKHVLEASHCFSLDSNWGVVGNWIRDSSCSWQWLIHLSIGV